MHTHTSVSLTLIFYPHLSLNPYSLNACAHFLLSLTGARRIVLGHPPCSWRRIDPRPAHLHGKSEPLTCLRLHSRDTLAVSSSLTRGFVILTLSVSPGDCTTHQCLPTSVFVDLLLFRNVSINVVDPCLARPVFRHGMCLCSPPYEHRWRRNTTCTPRSPEDRESTFSALRSTR